MTELRVEDIAYPGLAHVFSPPGLRLVSKSADAPPTTSVLVRGAAGTGKTTLALAVAHALAKAAGGIVLYVSTETSLADAIDKAAVLKLGVTPVPYDAAGVAVAGDVALAHLVVAREEAEEANPSRLAKLVIDYAYELTAGHKAGVKVHAVVVDSFELPDGATELGRSDLAAFVQSMESLGVSPVFVEEVGTSTSERLTFVVDTVFQLALTAESPTTALYRKLAVTKSRYAQAVPGPHDMAFDGGIPNVWPDAPSLDFGGPRKPVGFVFPLFPAPDDERTVLAYNNGAIVFSRYDADHQRIIRGLYQTPGATFASVECGPYILITDASSSTKYEIPTTFGPAAFAWNIHRILASKRANAIMFHRLEHLLAQPHFAATLPALLSRLVKNGFLVCIHGTSAGLQSIDELATFTGIGEGGHHPTNGERAPSTRLYRGASAWAVNFPGLPSPATRNIPEHNKLVAIIRAAQDAFANDSLAHMRAVALTDSTANDFASLWRRIETALLLHQVGQSSVAKSRLDRIMEQTGSEPRARTALAWAYAEIGEEWNAFTLAYGGIDQAEPPDALRRLWKSMYLRYSSAENLYTWAEPIQARLVAQALAGRGKVEMADQVLSVAAESQRLSAPHLARLKADVRLESPDPARWREADAAYVELLGSDGLRLGHRADIHFNRGAIAERLGDAAAAVELYRLATTENPLLEMADERLVALGFI